MRDTPLARATRSFRVNGKILTASIEIRIENLKPGPTGYRVKVIDYDIHRFIAPTPASDQIRSMESKRGWRTTLIALKSKVESPMQGRARIQSTGIVVSGSATIRLRAGSTRGAAARSDPEPEPGPTARR